MSKYVFLDCIEDEVLLKLKEIINRFTIRLYISLSSGEVWLNLNRKTKVPRLRWCLFFYLMLNIIFFQFNAK